MPVAGTIAQFDTNGTYNYQPYLTSSGTAGAIWDVGSASLTISGTSGATLQLPAVTVNSNTNTAVEMDGGAGTLTINVPVVLNNGAAASYVYNNSSNPLIFSGGISNLSTGALTIAGSGLVVLSSSNTYTGATTINAGTLQVTNSAALGSGNITMSGGTLELRSDTSATFGASAGSLTLTAGAVINVDQLSSGTNQTISLAGGGVIGGGYGLTVTGGHGYSLNLGPWMQSSTNALIAYVPVNISGTVNSNTTTYTTYGLANVTIGTMSFGNSGTITNDQYSGTLTVANISSSGSSSQPIYLGGNSSTSQVTGSITTTAASLVMQGTGTWTLGGNCAIAGTNNAVTGGVLNITGSWGNAP